MARVAAMVLAAGLGTRIGALSRFRPKPLLPVGPTTPFARAVDALKRAGIGRIVANASHLPEQIVEAGRALEVEVVLEEDGPLGTAGGLAHARDRLDADEVVVWNGDIVADIDLRALLDAHAARADALATLAVSSIGAPGTGNVGIDAEGRVVRLRRESFGVAGVEVQGAEFVPVHVLRKRAVQAAPSAGCLVGDLYLPALRQGAHLRAVACVRRWFDVGDLRTYLAANLAEPFVASDAKISQEITVDRCVIGSKANVLGDGVLREVVVWPGSTARAPLSRAIVVEADGIVRVG